MSERSDEHRKMGLRGSLYRKMEEIQKFAEISHSKICKKKKCYSRKVIYFFNLFDYELN